MAGNAAESPDLIVDLVQNCEEELGFDFKNRKLTNILSVAGLGNHCNNVTSYCLLPANKYVFGSRGGGEDS